MLAKLEALERGFYGVQTRAMSAIPKALAELDVRLQHALAEALPHQPRLAHAGVPAVRDIAKDATTNGQMYAFTPSLPTPTSSSRASSASPPCWSC